MTALGRLATPRMAAARTAFVLLAALLEPHAALAATGTGMSTRPVEWLELVLLLASLPIAGIAALLALPYAFRQQGWPRGGFVGACRMTLAWNVAMLVTSVWVVARCRSPQGCGWWQWPLLVFVSMMTLVAIPYAVAQFTSKDGADADMPAHVRTGLLVAVGYVLAGLLLRVAWEIWNQGFDWLGELFLLFVLMALTALMREIPFGERLGAIYVGLGTLAGIALVHIVVVIRVSG